MGIYYLKLRLFGIRELANLGPRVLHSDSREACLLECQIEQAHQICGCLPWDFPHRIENADFMFCDLMSNICFDQVFKNTSTLLKCNCPMECDYVSYSYSIVREVTFLRELLKFRPHNFLS